MGDRQKSRLSGMARTKPKLRIGKDLINSTEIINVIKYVPFKYFTDYREKGDRAGG